jgi:hypothetical protein
VDYPYCCPLREEEEEEGGLGVGDQSFNLFIRIKF